jgi:hypothetical protein
MDECLNDLDALLHAGHCVYDRSGLRNCLCFDGRRGHGALLLHLPSSHGM